MYRRIAGIVGAERAVRFAWVTAASATPFTPSSGSREAALSRIAREGVERLEATVVEA